MKKIFLIILFSILLVNCSKSRKEIDKEDSKIIYKLSEDVKEAILLEYQKGKNDQSNYYLIFYTQNCYYKNRHIVLIDDNINSKIQATNVINKSNRFVKLDEAVFLPVIFSADYFFEEKNKKEFDDILGYGVSVRFYLDNSNELEDVVRSPLIKPNK